MVLIGFPITVFTLNQLFIMGGFNFYMMLAAAEQWGWLGPNIFDEIFEFIFDQLDNNILISILAWPVKETLGVFLYIDEEEHFSPMNEWQAYFALITLYPYIWFYSQYFIWTHLSITPVILAWYLIDPSILVSGRRADGTNIPRDNYATVYATVDSITALLYGNLNWLYKGKEAYTIDVTSLVNHYVFNLVNLFTSPLVVWPMTTWLGISGFQVFVLYVYTDIISGGRPEVQDEVDIYY